MSRQHSRRGRVTSKQQPKVSRALVEQMAAISSAGRGCTCTPEVSIRHDEWGIHASIAHDVWCPASPDYVSPGKR